MSASLVSIILPVHNQADHVSGILADYVRALDDARIEHEILLVVNGSRDASFDVCNSLATKFSTVRVFNEQSGGWGRAVKRGIRESRGGTICYTNSARTTDRDLILILLYSRAFPNTVVKANRKIRENVLRRIGSLIYNIECRTLFDLSCWDINGTPKVFPRAFQGLLDLRRDDDLIDVEFDAVCRRRNYSMVEVPIFSTRRHGGRSTTNFRSAIAMYIGAYRLARQFSRDRR